jgi:hypothetical protein
VLVRSGQAGPAVDDEQDDVRHLGRLERLLPDAARQVIAVAGSDAACVDHGDAPGSHLRLGGQPVAGHPRFVGDDRLPAPEQAVEEGRLADVGGADDGNDRSWHGRRNLSTGTAAKG